MSRPGLFRAGVLSILRPDMPPAEVRALELLGRYITEAVAEYATSYGQPLARSDVEEYRYVLEVLMKETQGWAEFLVLCISNVEGALGQDTPDGWRAGYYADCACRLRRHLSTLALRIEELLDPADDEIRRWRVSLPKEIPAWDRHLGILALPARRRRPALTPSAFVISEVEADLALLGTGFDLLWRRTLGIKAELVNRQAEEEMAESDKRRLTELLQSLDPLVGLAEDCRGHIRVTLEGDPDAEAEDGP